VDVRIMNDAEHRRGPRNYIWFWAEYKLRYEVDGNRYEMWTPTNIAASTQAGAAGEAAHDRIDARFLVRYNPMRPGEAEAERGKDRVIGPSGDRVK
jgi:hypothetical protein